MVKVVDDAICAVQRQQMGDNGDHAEDEWDVEDLARRLFRLDSSAGVAGGLPSTLFGRFSNRGTRPMAPPSRAIGNKLVK